MSRKRDKTKRIEVKKSGTPPKKHNRKQAKAFSGKATLDKLPDIVLQKVFTLLPYEARFSLSRCSKRLNSIESGMRCPLTHLRLTDYEYENRRPTKRLMKVMVQYPGPSTEDHCSRRVYFAKQTERSCLYRSWEGEELSEISSTRQPFATVGMNYYKHVLKQSRGYINECFYDVWELNPEKLKLMDLRKIYRIIFHVGNIDVDVLKAAINLLREVEEIEIKDMTMGMDRVLFPADFLNLERVKNASSIIIDASCHLTPEAVAGLNTVHMKFRTTFPMSEVVNKYAKKWRYCPEFFDKMVIFTVQMYNHKVLLDGFHYKRKKSKYLWKRQIQILEEHGLVLNVFKLRKARGTRKAVIVICTRCVMFCELRPITVEEEQSYYCGIEELRELISLRAIEAP
ncbi:unnamed protein product [Caenorhabditis bovis]|uniref:F-box domain-containing protein n=1 Tax=Caenorhabditis bovis TaxID=2654633 RepID=A0A8S1EGV8_9PELO|nr:unnamed protein product [Caenorhabditis bovis]